MKKTRKDKGYEGYFLETSKKEDGNRIVSSWVNIGIAVRSLSGKAVTLILPQGKLHISINKLLRVISGAGNYAPIGFKAGDKISGREKRLMRNAFFRFVHNIPQQSHKAFLSSLSEEEKLLLGKS